MTDLKPRHPASQPAKTVGVGFFQAFAGHDFEAEKKVFDQDAL